MERRCSARLNDRHRDSTLGMRVAAHPGPGQVTSISHSMPRVRGSPPASTNVRNPKYKGILDHAGPAQTDCRSLGVKEAEGSSVVRKRAFWPILHRPSTGCPVGVFSTAWLVTGIRCWGGVQSREGRAQKADPCETRKTMTQPQCDTLGGAGFARDAVEQVREFVPPASPSHQVPDDTSASSPISPPVCRRCRCRSRDFRERWRDPSPMGG